MAFTQFLGVAFQSGLPDGGNVGTWGFRGRAIDKVRTSFDDDDTSSVPVHPSAPGFGAVYDQSEGALLDFSTELLDLTRQQAASVAARRGETNDYMISIRISFGRSEADVQTGWQTIKSFRLLHTYPLQLAVSVAHKLFTAITEATKSDDSIQLTRDIQFEVLGRPTLEIDIINEAGALFGGDDGGEGQLVPGCTSAPNGDCLLAVLYMAAARAGMGTGAKTEAINLAAQFASTRRAGKSAASVGKIHDTKIRVHWKALPESLTTADYLNPEKIIPVFQRLYPLTIHLYDSESRSGFLPIVFAVPSCATFQPILRHDAHFYTVTKPPLLRRWFDGGCQELARPAKRQKTVPLVLRDAQGNPHMEIQVPAAHATAAGHCTYCGRKGCDRKKTGKKGPKGSKRCRRCNAMCVDASCLLLHYPTCNGKPACKKCGETFEGAELLRLHACDTVPPLRGLEPHRYHQMPKGFVCFDIESARQESGAHVPVCLCVAALTFPEGYTDNCEKGTPPGGWQDLSDCSIEEVTYMGLDCCDDFAKDVFVNKRWPRHVTLAHNGANYDTRLVMDALIRRWMPFGVKSMIDGTSVKCVELPAFPGEPHVVTKRGDKRPFPAVRIIDSLSFLVSSLRGACKSYAVPLRKTFFSFSALNDFFAAGLPPDYAIPNPAFEDYPPPSDDADAADLRAHIAAREGRPFDFVPELLDYCMIDTKALLQVCVKYHESFAKLTYEMSGLRGDGDRVWVCPFQDVTLASAAMNMFKTLVYDPERFPLCNSHVEVRKGTGDTRQWLAYVSATEGLHMVGLHTTGQLAKLPGTKIEMAAFAPEEKQAFYHLWCSTVGCDRCKAHESMGLYGDPDSPNNLLTRSQALDKSQQLFVAAEAAGYTVRVIRSCELRALEKTEVYREIRGETRAYIGRTGRLDVRAAFRGGSTEAFALYRDCEPGEKIYCFDVTSMYPYAMTKKFPLPVGMPEILVAALDPAAKARLERCVAEQTMGDLFGLARCRLLLDNKQHFQPIMSRHMVELGSGLREERMLAVSCGACAVRERPVSCEHREELFCSECSGKELCNHLKICYACLSESMAAPCTHGPEERAMWLDLTTPEIESALGHGAYLIEVSEVHHFARTDHQLGDFIRFLYKAKQEASEYPPDVEAIPEGTPERAAAEERFCEALNARMEPLFGASMGLKRENFAYDGGRRQVSKLTMNSTYGKFATNPMRSETRFVRTSDQLRDILTTHPTSMDLEMIVEGRDDTPPTTVVKYQSLESARSITETTNVYIAALITAHARLILFDKLVELGPEKVLYCDTDSVICVLKESEVPPNELGALGDWTLEYDKLADGFAALGPKMYTLRRPGNPKGDLTKAKGIKGVDKSKMNMDSFRGLLVGENNSIFNRLPEMWFRTATNGDKGPGYGVKVVESGRMARVTSSKRVTGEPEYFGDGRLKRIGTVPFGFRPAP